MSFEDALKSATDGTIIDFEVSPGTRETRVPSGYNEWRKRIEARLKAAPERGKANDELIGALSGLLGVPCVNIEITAGATNSKKSVKIKGISRDEIIRILKGRV